MGLPERQGLSMTRLPWAPLILALMASLPACDGASSGAGGAPSPVPSLTSLPQTRPPSPGGGADASTAAATGISTAGGASPSAASTVGSGGSTTVATPGFATPPAIPSASPSPGSSGEI